MIGSPTIDGRQSVRIVQSRDQDAAIGRDHPGRWLGGVAGAVASLAVGIVPQLFGMLGSESGSADWTSIDWTEIGLFGVPVGFVLGRAFFPQARSGGWSSALWVGAGIGLLAPPLGAIEIMLGPALVPPDPATTSYALPAAVLFLMIAIPFSYIAVVLTVPAGLIWAVLVNLVPDDVPARLRAPKAIERLGFRHALLVLAAWALVVHLATAWRA